MFCSFPLELWRLPSAKRFVVVWSVAIHSKHTSLQRPQQRVLYLVERSAAVVVVVASPQMPALRRPVSGFNHLSIVLDRLVSLGRQPIELAQCIHDFVKSSRRLAPRRAQAWIGL